MPTGAGGRFSGGGGEGSLGRGRFSKLSGRRWRCGAKSSGYIARRLRDLCDEFGPLSRDHRVAELGAEIATLSTP
ncbi:hypothetical protein DKG71_17485 [Streptomyces sp. NEAU-S7GS2]|nr:hypothetical protein DKG71_17485 [Streptomyces sp. NEAU-S7GS2]